MDIIIFKNVILQDMWRKIFVISYNSAPTNIFKLSEVHENYRTFVPCTPLDLYFIKINPHVNFTCNVLVLTSFKFL